MSNQVNAHGLNRYIPAEIRRTLRRDAGQCCVICGGVPYTYEHIEPTFEHASRHDPRAMTLLCFQCQGSVTKGLISKETVWASKANPRSARAGVSRVLFDVSPPFSLLLGSNRFTTNDGNANFFCRVSKKPIRLEETYFGLKELPDAPLPYGLVMNVYDEQMSKVLEIDGNEMIHHDSDCDIEWTGNRLLVRDRTHDITLEVEFAPPHEVRILRMKMWAGPGDCFELLSDGGLRDPTGNTFYGMNQSGSFKIGFLCWAG